MQAEVPHGSHRLVALARLETLVRFARVLQHEPAAIPRVLTVFLGPLGICHPARVRETRNEFVICLHATKWHKAVQHDFGYYTEGIEALLLS